MTEEMRQRRVKDLKEFIDRETGWVNDAKKELAQLEDAAPVKRPIVALIPCKWEESEPYAKEGYRDYRMMADDAGCVIYLQNPSPERYPVRRVELCTSVNEIERTLWGGFSSIHRPTRDQIKLVLRAIGLPADV